MKLLNASSTGLYIDGAWHSSPTSLPVYNKYSGTVIREVAQAAQNAIDQAVEAAARAFKEPLPAHRRAAILRRAADLVRENEEAFARTIAMEGGKPYKDALAEVRRGVETIQLSSEEAKRIHGETIPFDAAPGSENRMGFYLRVPKGVVAAIAPFNFPINLVVHKVGPAIAAGCPVVLKPATTTPLTAIMLVEVLEEAGLPPGYLNLIIGPGGEIGDYLVRHPGIKMVTFTGSPPVGEHIRAIAGLKEVVLELGNNSGNIVHSDADYGTAARLLAAKAYGSAGQFCISVQRIYVHRPILDAFNEAFVAATSQLKVGDPLDPAVDVGPLITEGEAMRVQDWVDEAVSQGARVLAGGSRKGSVVSPTALVNVTPPMKVVAQEVFGPVASIIPYDDFNGALALLNQSAYGLQAGVFTNDIGRAWKAAKTIETGGVIINDTSAYRADLMPYGGVRLSGIGREGPRYAVEEMTEMRTIVFNL
jgi:acyl-CoA reductase-like NAD-dependent aldehyde dehydrogenase